MHMLSVISRSSVSRSIAIILLLFAAGAQAQVSPLQGTGFTQWFDNSGSPLVNGVLYFFQAGTSTQQATYTDSTGTILNPNPLPLTTGGRVNAWLTTANFYKIVLCLQNDGAFCAAGDILASADQVPGGSAGGGSGSCATGCTGFFISGTASPATSGTLRLASGDSTCWRNAAGSANLCWSKDSNDLLSWAGGSFKLPEVGAPAGVAAFDILWADSTAHRLKGINNGGSAAQYVLSGNDIGTTDNVTALHFGATQETLSSTAPTTNQFLQWNGTNIVGSSPQFIFGSSGNSGLSLGSGSVVCALNTGVEACERVILSLAHTLVRFTYSVATSPAGCTTSPVIGIKDVTSGTTLASATIANGASTVFVDSGALSVSMTAGDVFGIGVLTASVGCTTTAIVGEVRGIIQ